MNRSPVERTFGPQAFEEQRGAQTMSRKIVIGYDPEHEEMDAVRLGGRLCAAIGGEPIVLAALPWPDYLVHPADLQKQLDAEMKARFDVVREELAAYGVETRTVAERSAARALEQCAESEGAKLIVVGSTHRGPVGRTLYGSTGESLLHGAPCAVAVAPRRLGGGGEPGGIGVAFDGTPESWSALETAIGLAVRTRTELTVLSVADFLSYGYSTAWSVFTAGELEDAERREKRRLIDTALDRIPEGTIASGRLLVGNAGLCLAEVSSEFDLIVTGSRGYGPLRRTVLGSTTRNLISASACPVLILPRAVGTDPLGLRGAGGQDEPAESTSLRHRDLRST